MNKRTVAAVAAACALSSFGAFADQTFAYNVVGTLSGTNDPCGGSDGLPCFETLPYRGILTITAPNGAAGDYLGPDLIIKLSGVNEFSSDAGDDAYARIVAGTVTEINAANYLGHLSLANGEVDYQYFMTHGSAEITAEVVPEPASPWFICAALAAFALGKHRRSDGLRRQNGKDLLPV